jgi:glycosyltransferase involved in cell wall biosynthesis
MRVPDSLTQTMSDRGMAPTKAFATSEVVATVEAGMRPGKPGDLPSVHLYTPSADPSGMGVHMLCLAEEYVRQGRRVSLMYWPNANAEKLFAPAEERGVRLARIPHPRDPQFADRIADDLRRHPSDVFHLHVGTGRENWDGSRAAASRAVPAIVQTLHLPWLIRNRRKRGAVHTSLELVDRIITVSRWQRATYEKMGVDPQRMVTVPNGVHSRAWAPGRAVARRELGLSAEQPVVITVGRLTVMKGHRHLVDAMPLILRNFPDLVVVVVGEGHLRSALEEQAARLGVAHAVRFIGHRADARALLDAADVFVLPSRHEGMPLAALEAMDAGLPVVGTRVIGTSEAVADGVSGRLVPPGRPAALAAAIDELLSEPALRRRMGAAGRQRYEQMFTATRMARLTAAVYDEVLVRTGSGR